MWTALALVAFAWLAWFAADTIRFEIKQAEVEQALRAVAIASAQTAFTFRSAAERYRRKTHLPLPWDDRPFDWRRDDLYLSGEMTWRSN